MRRFILLFVLAAIPAFGSQTNVYLASGAAGVDDGSSCANAHIYTFFNSAGNWGAGATQIGPGTTVHLCGTITIAAASTALIFQASGTSGNPITLKFEPGAILQSPVFAADGGGVGNGGGIGMFNKSWITIDGNNTGQATQGTLTGGGIIQNTDNGDSLGHHCGTSGAPTTDCASTFIDGYLCSNCTIKNLQMLNLYVKVLNNTSTGVGGDSQHTNTMSGSHITITNNVIQNCGWCIFNNYGNGDTDVNVFNNDISGFGHGMMYATANAGAASISPALRFYGNHVHDPNIWTTPACSFHNDGLHTFGLLTGTSMDGLYIHDNYFNGTWGHCATGFLFMEQGSSNPSHAKNWAVWNNVGDATTETTWDNTTGWFGMFSGESGTQKVFNNTVLCGGPTHNMLGFAPKDGLVALSFENNVVSGCAEGVWMQPTPTVIDYNFYANLCTNGGNCFVWNGSFSGSFASWKTNCSCDSHAVQNNTPLLNADGSPQAGSPVIGIALNLSSQATGELAGLQNDTTLGNTRTAVTRPGGSTLWDDGAFQFGAGSPVVSLSPVSPLNFGNQSVNSPSASRTVTLTNTGTATLNITSITLTGGNVADFSITNNTCGPTLAASLSCVVSVSFTPSVIGSRTTTLRFTTNASTSPDNYILNGTGVFITAPKVQMSFLGQTGTISGSYGVQP